MTKLVFLTAPPEEPRPNYPQISILFSGLDLTAKCVEKCRQNHHNLVELLSLRNINFYYLFLSKLCVSLKILFMCVCTVERKPHLKMVQFSDSKNYGSSSKLHCTLVQTTEIGPFLNIIFETLTLSYHHKP